MLDNSTIVAWGGSGPVEGINNYMSNHTYGPIRQLEAGYFTSKIILPNGTLVSWGWNNYKELNVTAGVDHIIAWTE